MVTLDILKISNQGKELHCSFHVDKSSYYENIYLESLTIRTADQVSETDPLSASSEYVYKVEFEDGVKEYATILSPVDLNEKFPKSTFSEALFFVYIKCKGTISGDVPCRCDELTTLGVVFDESPLHLKVLGYTHELADTCNVPQGFTDFILLWHAFKSAIKTEHYIMAIKFWQMLVGANVTGSGKYVGTISNCGCHGKNSL